MVIDYTNYNSFYTSLCAIYKPLGFVDIFCNNHGTKNRKFHLIHNRTRLVFIYRMANKINLCYARVTRDIVSGEIPYTMVSAQCNVEDQEKLLKIHKFFSEKEY